ncbi:MAG TPA: tetratricopeptide repeat protein [Verrucomicrobiae bacterium]|nr:tetratricopeptide repeat protein [Verrucomicrobiae bacterium]
MAQDAHNDLRITDQFDLEVFWADHGKQITIGAVAAIAIAGFLLYRQYQSSTQAEQAAAMLANARDTMSLEQVIRDYPNSSTAAEAMSRLADIYYRSGKYTEAASTYERITKEFPSHLLAESAKLGLGTILEAQGNVEGAKAQYLQIINSGPNNYVVNAAKMGLARCLEVGGQKKEARQMYEEILALGQNSPWFTQAYLQWVVMGRDMPPEKPSESPVLPASSPAKDGLQVPALRTVP